MFPTETWNEFQLPLLFSSHQGSPRATPTREDLGFSIHFALSSYKCCQSTSTHYRPGIVLRTATQRQRACTLPREPREVTELFTRKMQNKTTVSGHFTPTGMAKIKKTVKDVVRMWENRNPCVLLVETSMGTHSPFRKLFSCFFKNDT